jgi:hypothetical protein
MPTAKPARARTLGVTITLASGDTVLVRPWGFDHLSDNIAVLTEIARDVMGLVDADSTAEDVLAEAVQRNMRRFRGLLVASLEHGEDDLQRLAGISDIVDVIDAIITANGILDAVSKVQARYQQYRERTTTTPNPT